MSSLLATTRVSIPQEMNLDLRPRDSWIPKADFTTLRNVETLALNLFPVIPLGQAREKLSIIHYPHSYLFI